MRTEANSKRYRLLLCSAMAVAWALAANDASAQANPPGTADPDSLKPAQPSPADPQAEPGAPVLGDIVVTARRESENLQRVPLAVTAFTGEMLTEKAIRTPTDLQFSVPSLQVTTLFGRLSGGYTVRGLANGVTTYFAEVQGGPTEASAPFYDIASVQVLNGPQGTQFGRANTAGAVLVEPAKPDLTKISGSIEGGFGNLGSYRGTAVLNVPMVTDQLGFRIAVNKVHRDGFTRMIGTDEYLDQDNNWGVRASLLVAPDGGKVFKNYSVFDWYAVDQTSGGWVVSAYNPNVAIFNLPANYAAPNGATAGTATFGTVCNQAVAAGLYPNAVACIDQRLRVAATFKPAFIAELARQAAGGPNSIRLTPAFINMDDSETLRKYTFVNQTDLNLGDLGFTTLSFRNIFGFQGVTGVSGYTADGIGGMIQSSASVNGLSAYPTAPSANVINGSQPVFHRGPFVETISDEIQARGVVGNDAFKWNVGYYTQNQPLTTDVNGVRNIFQNDLGILNPTLGFTAAFGFNAGGYIRQHAYFGSGTIDFVKIFPGLPLEGLRFTAGYRKSFDRQSATTRAAVLTLPSGTFVPGTATTAVTSSNGINRAFTLDAQVTNSLLLYVATRKGYRPGGLNLQPNVSSLPGFNTVYQPESVKDWEVGVKYQFRAGGLAGRINAAAYRSTYGNIQRTYSGLTSTGTSGTYIVNAAEARLQGFEISTDFVFSRLSITGTYSYTDAKFTKWVGSDPLALIKVGNAACLPQSTAAICLIDLSNNPLAGVAKHQGSITLTYDLPVAASVGKISLSASGYYQSRRYFNDQAQRNLDAFGPIVLNTVSQAPFAKLNLRAQWTDMFGSSFSSALYVNNATNKVYTVSGISQLHSLGMAAKLYAEPRTYGMTLGYKF